MGNIAYFEIPSDDVERAKRFYAKVFGWEIKKTPMPNMPDYASVTTGKAFMDKGMSYLNMGGVSKRMFPGQPITNYVQVDSVDKTLELVKKSGGKQMGEKIPVPTVGMLAFISDSEGNMLGLWEAEKKK
ncbi:MAG: VOC family protein [Candidatus Micrarchaeia archaeon]